MKSEELDPTRSPCSAAPARAAALLAVLGLAGSTWGQAAVIDTLAVPDSPDAVAVDVSRNRFYVTVGRGSTNELWVFDGATHGVLEQIPVGSYPNDVAVNEGLGRVYVTNHYSHNVSVINSATNGVVATVPTGTRPNGLAVNPLTHRVYTANVHGNNVTVIDGTNNTRLTDIPTGSLPVNLDVNPVTNRVYVCNQAVDNVTVIDGATNSVLATTAVGDTPTGVLVDPNRNLVYVSNALSRNITIIDGVTNLAIGTIPTGIMAGRMALDPTYGQIYAHGHDYYPGPSSLLILDSYSYELIDTVPLQNAASWLDVNPDSHRVYVVNNASDSVSVVQAVPFCDYQFEPDIVLCDDFSGADPLSSYTVTTPRGSGQNGMDVFVDLGRLIFRQVTGWSVAIASHDATFDFSDSILEADVRIETSGGGACGLEWVGDAQNRFQVFLDLSADNVNIDALVANSWLPRVAASYAFDAHTTYRLRMDVQEAGRVLVYVDDVLLIDASLDLTPIPRTAHPSFVGFTHSPGDMVFDNLLVRVANHAPVAAAGSDQTVDEGDPVTLDGSDSYDPDGDPIVDYAWTQIAGTPVVLNELDPVRPTLTAPYVPAGGEMLTFELVIDDGELQSEPALTNVWVKNVNNPPVADAGPDQLVQEGGPVTLDGTGSYDEDGEPLTYAWTQTLGTSVQLSDTASPQPDFTAPFVGVAVEMLVFDLAVYDGVDWSLADTVLVLVENVNHPPVAEAGDPQTVGELTVAWLNGTACSDPDQDPLVYEWSQLSGPYVTLSDPQAAEPWFLAPSVVGTPVELEFELRACDPFDCDTDTVTVTVLSTNSPPECSLARASVPSLWPPNHKMISISVIGVTDPDDDSVVITVTGVTQDEPVDGTGSGDTAPDAVLQADSVLLRAERAGTGNGRVYIVSFQADDGQGGVCNGSFTVCVPHDKRSSSCPDDGQLFDSTQP